MHNKRRNEEYIEDVQMVQPVKKKRKRRKKEREDYLLSFTGCCL